LPKEQKLTFKKMFDIMDGSSNKSNTEKKCLK